MVQEKEEKSPHQFAATARHGWAHSCLSRHRDVVDVGPRASKISGQSTIRSAKEATLASAERLREKEATLAKSSSWTWSH